MNEGVVIVVHDGRVERVHMDSQSPVVVVDLDDAAFGDNYVYEPQVQSLESLCTKYRLAVNRYFFLSGDDVKISDEVRALMNVYSHVTTKPVEYDLDDWYTIVDWLVWSKLKEMVGEDEETQLDTLAFIAKALQDMRWLAEHGARLKEKRREKLWSRPDDCGERRKVHSPVA